MFVLNAYFTESSLNAVDLFTQFLLSTPFSLQRVGFRPDQAKGFVNLKRVINASNLMHSTPGGFYMASDFARPHSPKDKAHLESSHRSLHNFEIRIIKAFEDRIADTVPGCIFNRGKKEKITVTLLDITLQDLKDCPLLKEYRNEHNHTKHYFSEKAKIREWVPPQKLDTFLSSQDAPLTFTSDQVLEYMKYGFKKIKATVSKKRTIRHENRDYYVTCGAELFSKHKSTPVQISRYKDKLFIFEQGENGILLGEALAQKPFEKLPEPTAQVQPDELDRIITLLEKNEMIVYRPALIEVYHKGLSLVRAKQVLHQNQSRYTIFTKKMRQPHTEKGAALFRAFILDCERSIDSNHVPTYATNGDLT